MTLKHRLKEKTEGGIILLSEDEMKAKQALDILISNLIKRNVDPKDKVKII